MTPTPTQNTVMGCLGCQRCEDESTVMVELHTGVKVCSDCPEWLQECEAKHLLDMPLHQRREALAKREKMRGKDEVERIKGVMKCLHEKKKQEGI